MLRHVAIVGKTGAGKSVLLERLALADIEAGRGIALLDPHGDLAERVVAGLPRRRRNDLVLLAPGRSENRVTLNVFAHDDPEERPRVASAIVSVFRRVAGASWGPRSEHLLRHAALALLTVRGATLADLPVLLTDAARRTRMMAHVDDPIVREFWLREFPGYGARLAADASAPLLNKVGALIGSPTLRAVLCSRRRGLDVGRIMDAGSILVADLSKGAIGEDASAMLGAVLLAKIQLAAYARAARPSASRRPFHVYVDEVGTIATTSLAELLAEGRKFGVGLVLAFQYLGQLPAGLDESLLTNTGTLVCFRLGPDDAERIGREFSPELGAHDLMRLAPHETALRLSIDGVTSAPFSATTMVPLSLRDRVPDRANTERPDGTPAAST